MSVMLTALVLMLSIAALWLPRHATLWAYLFSASLMLAAFAGIVSAAALLILGAAAVCVYLINRAEESPGARARPARSLQGLLVAVFSMLAVGIATGWFSGFERVALYSTVQLSADAAPYTLTFNYGKAAIGVLILGLCTRALQGRVVWPVVLRTTLIAAVLTIATVSALSIALGYTRFDPKWDALFLPWAAVNLFFICVAEEAFFRAFLQRGLAGWLASARYGAVYAWWIASLLFSVAHVGGGAGMMLLAGVAGLGYGWVYMKTGRVEAAVLMHFLLNAAHIVFLTYPRLA